MKVFLTDGTYKHTLAITRALGKKGIYVIVGSSSNYSQSFYSKYCKAKVLYPNPKNEKMFVDFMIDYNRKNKIDVLLPIGDLCTTILSKHKDSFFNIKLPVADYSSMKIASDKNKTMEFAKKIGIETPQIIHNKEEIKFPVVIKEPKGSGNIHYANSSKDLFKFSTLKSVIQEYIPGEGYGFFALFNKGEPRAIFMHKRIREYPITGGSSTMAESIYDFTLKEFGLKILKTLGWHGVAMVEFKKDNRDGKFKLMEINPKFWGSLDLAIASGVNFPYLICEMAVKGDIKPIFRYKTGVKFRWPFPDDFFCSLSGFTFFKSFILDFLNKDIKTNIDFSDIKPNIMQLLISLPSVLNKIRKKRIRYPHGKPILK